MTDENQMARARDMYNSLCAFLDDAKLKYEKSDDKLMAHFIMTGKDLPMDMIVEVLPERQLVRVLSRLPFAFSEPNRVLGAVATCCANYAMTDGSFDYNFNNGSVFFRATSNYIESLLSSDVFGYMIALACYFVDEYNDKFLMLDKGMLSIDAFFKKN